MRFSIERPDSIFTRLLSFLAVSFVLVAFAGGAPATAAPVSDLQTAERKIFARACPAVNDLVPQLKAKGLAGNTIFYTKPVPARQASGFAGSLHPIGQGFFSLVSSNQQLDWIDQCNVVGAGQNAPAEQNKLVPRISQALAQGATGTAYILISAGADINAPGTIWGTIEFPTLQRNSAITQVIRVDPENTNSQSVVWTGGDTPTLPPSTAP